MDLAGAMAEERGLKRRRRGSAKLLEPTTDPDILSDYALATVLFAMGNRQNWGDVSYAASNFRTIEQKVQAQWMFEDSKAIMRDYYDQMTPEQHAIAEAAFAGGLADTPVFNVVPADVSLDWVKANYPSRPGYRR